MRLNFKLDRDELASRLGGALPGGSLCLIEGGSGAGKSVLAQRLTYGLLQHGHEVTFVSTEFTTPAFMDQMEQLNYPVLDHFIDHKLWFVPTNPLAGHAVPSNELLPRLISARSLLTKPVVVVDIFSQVLEPHLETSDRGDRVLEHVMRTLKKINAAGTTLILTIDPAHLEGIDTTVLTSAADIRLQCLIERKGGQVDRFVVTKKFARAFGMVGDVIPFRVEAGAGFIVEIKAVS